jgi:transcriptional regulator with XRE-family HTH domain
MNAILLHRKSAIAVNSFAEAPMLIGDRLKQVRESKNLSQGTIEERTGMLRCYISRVENGHTVPSIETLEKFAHALGVPMYQLFYDGKEPKALPSPKVSSPTSKEARAANDVARLYSRIKRKADRNLLMALTRKLAAREA